MGIGLLRGQNIHPIQRRKLIKMHNVILNTVSRQDDITDILRVDRHRQIERIFYRAYRGDGVHRGAYTANTLHDNPRIARVFTLQDLLHTAPHRARRPGFYHFALLNFAIDPQMSLDSGDRINSDALAHAQPLFGWKGVAARAAPAAAESIK